MVADKQTTSISETHTINLSTPIYAPLVEHRDGPKLDKTINDPYESDVEVQNGCILTKGVVVGGCRVLWSVTEPFKNKRKE